MELTPFSELGLALDKALGKHGSQPKQVLRFWWDDDELASNVSAQLQIFVWLCHSYARVCGLVEESYLVSYEVRLYIQSKQQTFVKWNLLLSGLAEEQDGL